VIIDIIHHTPLRIQPSKRGLVVERLFLVMRFRTKQICYRSAKFQLMSLGAYSYTN